MSEKLCLNLYLRTSWQIDVKTMETVTEFIFLGSKISVNGDCSHEIKTLAPWKRSYEKQKSRDTSLPTKVHIVKAMVFLVVMYGCESWTIKKAECQRIDAFALYHCDPLSASLLRVSCKVFLFKFSALDNLELCSESVGMLLT